MINYKQWVISCISDLGIMRCDGKELDEFSIDELFAIWESINFKW